MTIAMIKKIRPYVVFVISGTLKICLCLILYAFTADSYAFTADNTQPGNLVTSDKNCAVWWTGSTYKVARDAAAPVKKAKVLLRSARNETESFQLVLSPKVTLENIRVSISSFQQKSGHTLEPEQVTIRKVEYVAVTKPSGNLHKKGWYPDPLPELKNPFLAEAGKNHPVWFTVKVPDRALPGTYKAEIKIEATDWKTTVPVELKVWNFTLPEIPHMRSGFALSPGPVKDYHNLDTDSELKEVMDHYYKSCKAYKISPQKFYDLYPIKKATKGVAWKGGTFDPDTVFQGRYSYQVSDHRTDFNVAGKYTKYIEINPAHPYLLKWYAKTLKEGQKYTVTVNCYDSEKQPINWSLKWMAYPGSKSWREDSMYIDPEKMFAVEDLPDFRPFPEHTRYASIQIYAVLPDQKGSEKGTVWVDDFRFIDQETSKNLLPEGNFEQDINALDLDIDFSEFDIAARKYLDGLGFTGFRVQIPELRLGPFVGKKAAWFDGFISGTPEYEKLIGLYLKGFQDHLEANGWLGKEYLYWVDEPKPEAYGFVREGMNTIRRVAPKLTRFLAENNPREEIMEVVDTNCPVLYKINPEEVKKWKEKGRNYWSYFMCWPKEPHVNLFIDSDAINMRMWVWISYRYDLTGVLVWRANKWNDKKCSPPGVLQNIWKDPMTYKSGFGTPFGSAAEFGNGDGMFFYPPNRDPENDKTKHLTGPVPSLRLEILREGLDDYDYMIMLEHCIENARPDQQPLVKKAKQVLAFGSEVFVNDTVYTKDPEVLMKYRRQMGNLLEQFHEK